MAAGRLPGAVWARVGVCGRSFGAGLTQGAWRPGGGGAWVVLGGEGGGLGRRVGGGEEVVAGLAPALALFGRESLLGASGVVGLAGVVGVVDADVAGDEDGGCGQREPGRSVSRQKPRWRVLVAGSETVEKVRSEAVRRL